MFLRFYLYHDFFYFFQKFYYKNAVKNIPNEKEIQNVSMLFCCSTSWGLVF